MASVCWFPSSFSLSSVTQGNATDEKSVSSHEKTNAIIKCANISARALLQSGKAHESRTLAQEVLTHFPHNFLALNTYVRACLCLNHYNNVHHNLTTLLQNIEALAPQERALVYSSCAYVCFHDNNYKEATSYMRSFFETNQKTHDSIDFIPLIANTHPTLWEKPGDQIELLFMSALYYIEHDLVEKAEGQAKHLLEIAPIEPKWHQVLAYCALTKSPPDYTLAFNRSNSAVALDEGDVSSLTMRCFTGFFVNFENALRDAKILLDVNPNSKLFNCIAALAFVYKDQNHLSVAHRDELLNNFLGEPVNLATRFRNHNNLMSIKIENDPTSIFNHAWECLHNNQVVLALADNQKLMQLFAAKESQKVKALQDQNSKS